LDTHPGRGAEPRSEREPVSPEPTVKEDET
jgi:hypothetical protein